MGAGGNLHNRKETPHKLRFDCSCDYVLMIMLQSDLIRKKLKGCFAMEELGIFLFFLILLIIAENPWLLVAAGIVATICVVVATKHPGNSSGSSYSGTYSSASAGNGSADSCSYNGDSSGYLYTGQFKGDYDMPIATFRNRYVFQGYDPGLLDFSVIRACYRDGFIFDGSFDDRFLGTVLGRFEGGRLYHGDSTCYNDLVARIENGKIYRGDSTWNSDIIATYTGDDEGAAAAAIKYLF